EAAFLPEPAEIHQALHVPVEGPARNRLAEGVEWAEVVLTERQDRPINRVHQPSPWGSPPDRPRSREGVRWDRMWELGGTVGIGPEFPGSAHNRGEPLSRCGPRTATTAGKAEEPLRRIGGTGPGSSVAPHAAAPRGPPGGR